MGANKIEYFGNTLIDLTNDTVTTETLAEGVTAHDKSGNVIIGVAFGAKLTAKETTEGVQLTATDKNGTSTATVKNGKTPVKGVDYFTEADKTAIVIDVMNAIGCPLFGIVDENNTVVLTGKLPDGSYNIKYEMADGSTVNIGSLVLDTNVYYTVTNSLTNCTNGNSATSVVEGGSYSATISANDGYELSSVKVTMGGTDITSSVVSGGTISIVNVTGDIVITAVAEEKANEPINQIPISIDESGNPYNNGQGWKTGVRLKGSTGLEDPATGVEVTGFIEAKYGDTVYLKGIVDDGTHVMGIYDTNYAKLQTYGFSAIGLAMNGSTVSFTIGQGDIYQDNLKDALYLRVSANEITDASIITVNEPIE